MTNKPTTQSRMPETKDELIDRCILRYKENKDMKDNVSKIRKEYNEYNEKCERLEENLRSLQNTGQLIGEVLKQMDDDKYIVKLLNGPRYVVTSKKQ